MFLSQLKIAPNSNPPAGTIHPPKEDRAGRSETSHHDRNARHANSNHARGAVGALAGIALLMWFISFFLLAGPGVGISGNAGVQTSSPPAANVAANTPDNTQ